MTRLISFQLFFYPSTLMIYVDIVTCGSSEIWAFDLGPLSCLTWAALLMRAQALFDVWELHKGREMQEEITSDAGTLRTQQWITIESTGISCRVCRSSYFLLDKWPRLCLTAVTAYVYWYQRVCNHSWTCIVCNTLYQKHKQNTKCTQLDTVGSLE